jgi:hypothetical protein
MAYLQKTRPKIHATVRGEGLTASQRFQLSCERVHAKVCGVIDENSPKSGTEFAQVAMLSEKLQGSCQFLLYENASAQFD